MTAACLVADVGGTNVRFALASRPGDVTAVRRYQVADHPTFEDALATYIRNEPSARTVTALAIGAAGPVENGTVQLTNAPWAIRETGVSAMLNGSPVRIINDLEAVAAGLPHLGNSQLDIIRDWQRGEQSTRKRMLAVNVGTGFGAAVVAPRFEHAPHRWCTTASESGHMTLARDDVFQGGDFRSVEDVLSGRGVSALYKHLGGQEPLGAAEIFAHVGSDTAAARSMDLFSTLLGRAAGDLVLATSAWYAVYLCGSVVSGWRQTDAASGSAEGAARFLAAFDDKGPMSDRMAHVGVSVITHDDPALFGLSFTAHDLLQS